jgi:trimeric autotransporter adhesin
MKKQNSSIKAHLLWSALILLSLVAVCAIPFALAQSRSRGTARQSVAKSAILLPSSPKPAESKLQIPVAANADLQGASLKSDGVTKTPEAPVTENPDVQDSIYRPAESSAFAGAGSKDQYFLELPEVTCGAGNIRVEATNSGNNADYATLKDAFDAINAGTHTGVINIGVCGDTTETASAVLNASGGTANYTLVLITPTGVRTVSGAIVAGSPLIDLNGADNVTIDGLSSGGNSLTISNTTVSATAGTSTIRLINGAQTNTITRCTVLGSSTASTTVAGGNILISTSTGGANSNNAILNNAIGPAGTNLPTKCVMSLGSASPNNNTGNLIDNNNVFDFFSPTISVAGISVQTNNVTTTITNNRVYQTAPRTFTVAALTYTGILVQPGSTGSATITGNTIGFGAADGTGITTISGLTNRINGINASSTSTTVATSIQNNRVSGFNQTTSQGGTTTASGFIGISVGSTAGLFNIGGTIGNNIGSLDGSSSIVINNSTVTTNTWACLGIFDFSFQSGEIISNNGVGTIAINNGGTGTGSGFRGIRLSGTAAQTGVVISNNTIGGTAAGSITDNVVGTYNMYGIDIVSATFSATGNLIRNMVGNAQAAGFISMSGIIISTPPTGASTISQNTIHSLSDNAGTVNGAIYAIYGNFPATANVVERNFVHSLSITSTNFASQLAGVLAVAGRANYQNNMVRLGVDAAGASITGGYQIIGMFEIAGTNNLYYNSVYVGGTGVVSASTTFGFVSIVTAGTRNYKDNIFWNARSNVSGTGKNYAIALSGLSGMTSNYNDLYANGVGGFVGSFGGDQLTLANWQAATGQDANSISANPLFVNPNGTAATVDLHIMPGSPCIAAATPISGIPTDFDNNLRNPCTPDIGADEVTPYSGPQLANVSITKTADAPVVVSGSQIAFTVRLTNNSSFTATGLTFTDNLPAAPGVNWSIDAANTDAGWSVSGSPPSQSLVYSPSTLAGGTTTRAHVISATTTDTCGSTLNNMASYTVSNGCPGSGSGSASASVSVLGPYVPFFSENFDGVTPPALPAGRVQIRDCRHPLPIRCPMLRG